MKPRLQVKLFTICQIILHVIISITGKYRNFSYFCPRTKYVGVVRGDDGDDLQEEDLLVLKNRVTLLSVNRSLERDFQMLPIYRLEKTQFSEKIL